MKIVIVSLIAVGVILLAGVTGVIRARNELVRHENGIVAVQEDMKNVHASIFSQIKSQGLSIEKYGDMVIKAINAGMSGRYGEKGARGAMLWIQEQNPSIDPKVMERLQVAIEAGYNRFESTKRTKIDRLRVYDNAREEFPKNLVAGLFGFPKKVTADMRTTISSAETDAVMQSKQLKVVNPFAK